jgi:hypothetical protein
VTAALTLACLWAVAAGIAGMMPQRFHWPAAFALIVTGIPMLGYVTWIHGGLVGLLVLAGGASMLRWPIIRLFGWVVRPLRQRRGP